MHDQEHEQYVAEDTECRHEIFKFNWETDAQNAPPPISALLVEKQNAEQGTLSYLAYPWYGYRTVVQADPNDDIQLESPDGRHEVLHAHRDIWSDTIDKYLMAYEQVMKKKMENLPGKLNKPIEADILLDNYREQSKDRRKPLPPFLKINFQNRPKNLDNSKEELRDAEPYIMNAVANLVLRWLSIRKNNLCGQLSLDFDGLPLWLDSTGIEEGKVRALEPFILTEYLFHERLTGISLSIEITAILLEYQDDKLVDKALDAFKQDAVGHVVSCPMVFSRICAARNYFRQILIEEYMQQYEWRPRNTEKEKAARWQECTVRALRHVSGLNRYANSDWIEGISGEEIDGVLEYLTKLIKRMKIPIDLFEYVKNPHHGLAIFCNPKHKNVDFFIEELHKGQESKMTDMSSTTVREHCLFRKVHAIIRKAIWKLYE